MKKSKLTIACCLAISSILLASCSSGTSKADSQDAESATSEESTEMVMPIESAESSSTDNDWDAVLDSYESYMDKYIALMKKAQSGDMNALAEYPKILEEAQDLQDKLEGAKSDLTPQQAARLANIATKMAGAM